MSYILDALKRSASDAQVGHAPGIHTQSVAPARTVSGSWLWPAITTMTLAATVITAYTLQPWSRFVAEQQPQIIESEVQLVGAIDYSQYAKRQRVALPEVRQPQPEVHTQPLPAQPVSAGLAQGEQTAVQLEESEPKEQDTRVGGSQLEALFAQAVAETQSEPQVNVAQITPLTEKPQAFQSQVPSMSFSAHSYSSEPHKRMIKVNGISVREGGWIGPEVQVIAIEPSRVVMQMQGEQFSLPALSDW